MYNQGIDPQATFTPVGCNITVFSICTPVCGAAAAAQQASPQATFTPVGCNITAVSYTHLTLPTICSV